MIKIPLFFKKHILIPIFASVALGVFQLNAMEADYFNSISEYYQPHSLTFLAGKAFSATCLTKDPEEIEIDCSRMPRELASETAVMHVDFPQLLHNAQTPQRVLQLLACGADPNYEGYDGPPLSAMLARENHQAAITLIKNTRNKLQVQQYDTPDYLGLTPQDRALGNPELIKLFPKKTEPIMKGAFKKIGSMATGAKTALTKKPTILLAVEEHMKQGNFDKAKEILPMQKRKKLTRLINQPINNRGWRLLHKATTDRQVSFLLSLGADPTLISNKQEMPLHAMIKQNHDEAALTLLKKRPKISVDLPDLYEATPLCYAARYGSLKLIEELLKRGADINYCYKNGGVVINPLVFAAQLNRDDIVNFIAPCALGKTLEKEKCSLILFNTALAAAKNNNKPMFDFFAQNTDLLRLLCRKKTLFMYAATKSDPAFVQQLLDWDVMADPRQRDKKGRTPLMLAARYGNPAVCNVLLAKDIQAIEDQDQENCTALMYALYCHHCALTKQQGVTKSPKEYEACIQALVANILNVKDQQIKEKYLNIQDKGGKNALFFALHHLPFVTMLCEAGINVDAQDNLGNTALIQSCTNECDDSVKMQLLKAGADVSIKNKKGKDALRSVRMGDLTSRLTPQETSHQTLVAMKKAKKKKIEQQKKRARDEEEGEEKEKEEED